MTLTAEIYTPPHVSRKNLRGAAHQNKDGTDRQTLLASCHEGLTVNLRREPDNPHDRWAIAVDLPHGGQLGYLPREDRRLASHLDQGLKAEAKIVEITGRTGLMGRLFGKKKPLGCVIEVTKDDLDWKEVESRQKLYERASELIEQAKALEKDEPQRAVEIYREAARELAEKDALGPQVSAYRYARHPIPRLSLLLERASDFAGALREIEAYLDWSDYVGLTKTEEEGVRKRLARLKKKVKSDRN